ncbi:MAG: hypothetical protein KQI35_07280 [Bacteroidetes bacterium]|nr:hypothetical protein [Bacteroidota bacterium]
MKKIDKLKRQRFEISMKIIEIESKIKVSKKTINLEKELTILKEKENTLTKRIEEL